jgi:hypothetical protein
MSILMLTVSNNLIPYLYTGKTKRASSVATIRLALKWRKIVTAEFVFQIANGVALAAWVALGCAIVFRRDGLRRWVGYVPITLSALYSLLILLFFFKAEGGFDTLANVQKLFTSPWAALAGWVHYLAFDLLVGTWIARETALLSLPRWPMIALLPLTFMFGPAGYLGFEITKFLLTKEKQS